MDATLSGLAPSPFALALPEEPSSASVPELLALYPEGERTSMRGLYYGLLFQAMGASLALAAWKLR